MNLSGVTLPPNIALRSSPARAFGQPEFSIPEMNGVDITVYGRGPLLPHRSGQPGEVDFKYSSRADFANLAGAAAGITLTAAPLSG